MRMKRSWMTGCMALMLLVAGRGVDAAEREDGADERPDWVSMSSPLSVDETVRRLRKAAERRGLSVVAEVKPATAGDDAVLVLGTEDGHTPMVQNEQAALPALPMQVVVQARRDGSSLISYQDAQAWLSEDSLPDELRGNLVRLPTVVAAVSGPPPRSGVDGLG